MQKVEEFVKSYFEKNQYDPSHDFSHVERVHQMAMHLALKEQQQHHLDNSGSINLDVVSLAAYLHDIGDFKYTQNENAAEEIIRPFLKSLAYEDTVIDQVLFIVQNLSYRKSLEKQKLPTKFPIEFQIVQDADRLDAIGAIGIARCFSFGAVRKAPFYDPNCPPLDPKVMTREQYDALLKQNKSITMNHFDEKLFLLKDKMNTETARQLAVKRHEFMQQFVQQFKNEWHGVE